jgi:hypothetical protein
VLPLLLLGQLVTPEKEAALRAQFPATADQNWQTLFRESVLYTEAEVPRAYQFAGTFHSPAYNISGDPSDSGLPHGEGGNANVDFPWRLPGGVPKQAERDLDKFAFVRLPRKPDGGVWPVVYFSEFLRDDPVLEPATFTRWLFPRDTVFGEVLQLKDSQGKPHVFEVRLRVRTADGWGTEALRPFPTVADMQERLAELGTPEARDIAAKLGSVKAVAVDALTDKHRTRHAFSEKAARESLPPMSEALVKELLATPFKPIAGYAWREAAAVDVFAPTSQQRFSVVPLGYNATFIGSDSQTCMNCHDDTLKPARSFDAPRGWYGRVRGSDGIFSFHPIEPSSISRNGSPVQVRIRQSLVRAGMVERYDRAKHPADRYSAIKGVK